MNATLIAALGSMLMLYWSLSVVLETSKKYRSRAYTDNAGFSSIRKFSTFLERSTKKRIHLTDERYEALKQKLYRVGWEQKPEDIAAQQFIFGAIAMVGFSLILIATNNGILIPLAVLFGAYLFYFPIIQLNRAIRNKEEEVRTELPDFIDLLILLFSAGLTPFNAIKKASEQASPGLRLDAERLVADLNVLTEEAALDRFAENLGITQAKRFVFAMKQAIQMSKGEAQQIFKQQSAMMRDMRVQTMRRMIKERPQKVQFISMGLFAFVLAIPVGVIVLNFISIFSQFTG